MRILSSLAFLLGVAALPAFAQPFRVVTWQVPDMVLPRQTNSAAAPATEPPRLAEIITALSATDADAVILYGISDSQTIKRIAEGMKPRKFSVAIHSVFRQNGTRGPLVSQPFAVLAKRDKMSAKNIEWSDTGRIDMPGGFAFATLKHGNGAVCVYVANLPGSLTNGVGPADGAYFIRKRNAAADFLAHHAAWVAGTYTNQPFATYLTGDINLVSKKPVKDDCAPTLEKAGFRPVPLGNAQDKSTLAITNSPALLRVFDPVFTRNVEFMATRQTPGPAPADQPLVICEVTVKPPGSASVAPPARKSSSKPEPKPEPRSVPEPVAPVPTPAAAQLASAKPVAAPAPAPLSPERPRENTAPAVNARADAAAVPPLKPTGVTASAGNAASESRASESWVWMTIAGASLGLLGLAVLTLRSGRRERPPALLGRPVEAVFVEMKPGAAPAAVQRSGDAVLSSPTTATDNAHNGVWQTPSVRLEPAAETHARGSKDLMPHMRQLLRERLFKWLTNQRQTLLDSQEAGTAQVMGLEERLDKLRGQFQDRLVQQEQRIAEMDRELREKERLLNENRKPDAPDSGPTLRN